MSRDFIVTMHAARRAVDMCVEAEEIRELMAHPEIRRWDITGSHQPGWLYKRGDLAAIVDEFDEGKSIIRTFLPATDKGWEAESHFPPSPGRDPSRYLKN